MYIYIYIIYTKYTKPEGCVNQGCVGGSKTPTPTPRPYFFEICKKPLSKTACGMQISKKTDLINS